MNAHHEATPPRVLVFSSLFPSAAEPGAGLFIRERMFRVAEHLPIVVVAPRPWFPGQGLIRLFRPHFRPPAPRFEIDDGVEVHRPRFLSPPGFCKWADGRLMALGAARALRRIRRRFDFDLIDAHFGYPDGYAATLLGRSFGVPVSVTLRGTEARLARTGAGRQRLRKALAGASRVFAVSESLRRIALEVGVSKDRTEVVANGVDTERFHPIDQATARANLGIDADATVLISVGTLVERKGFHRVLEVLPALRRQYPNIVYLIVGGPGPEGDWRERLEEQATRLGVADCVRFLGQFDPRQLHEPLSAADLFVLATGNEGWANVFLEAMACGLPVVTTDVGGNREVVASTDLGIIVPLEDRDALKAAIGEAVTREWDRGLIVQHARGNAWTARVTRLVAALTEIVQARNSSAPKMAPEGGRSD